MTQKYRLVRKTHPYVPWGLASYGPGCAIPWPDFSSRSVGYIPNPTSPGNMELPDGQIYPDGGLWEILTVWGTGWMSIRSLITGELIFSVPPGTLEPVT